MSKTLVVTVPVKIEVDLDAYAREYNDYPARTKDERDAIRAEIHERVIEWVRQDFFYLDNIYTVKD